MNLADKQTWLELSYCPSITAKKRAQIWQKTIEEDLWDISIQQFISLFFKPSKREIIKEELTEAKGAKESKEKIIFINDKEYPPLLREIYEPPPILFYEGKKALLKEVNIAVVGARKMTTYGNHVVEYIVKELTEEQFTITSGLAFGIDGKSHQVALENKGSTIAVLGSGLSNIYPSKHLDLARRIAAKGLLITEHHPDVKAKKWHFPERNRIISGISQGTLVIEATERSGSLITAELALEQNRLVYAVPGEIFDRASDGTNQLIAEGAIVTRRVTDIIETFPTFNPF